MFSMKNMKETGMIFDKFANNFKMNANSLFNLRVLVSGMKKKIFSNRFE